MPGSLDRHWRRFLARHFAIGTVVATAVFAGMVATNALGLAELAARDQNGPLALVLLWFGLWITFCSVAMGTAIMSVGPETCDPRPGPPRSLPSGMRLAPVRIRPRRR